MNKLVRNWSVIAIVAVTQTGCMWWRSIIHEEFGDLFQAQPYTVGVNVQGHVAGVPSELHLDAGDTFTVTKTLNEAFIEPVGAWAAPTWQLTSGKIKFAYAESEAGGAVERYLCNDNVMIAGERHVVKVFPIRRASDNRIGVKMTYDDYSGTGSNCEQDEAHNGEAHAWI